MLLTFRFTVNDNQGVPKKIWFFNLFLVFQYIRDKKTSMDADMLYKFPDRDFGPRASEGAASLRSSPVNRRLKRGVFCRI